MKQLLVAIALAVCTSGVVVGYELQAAEQVWSAPETTPAYGVLILRKAAVDSELADLLGMLTNQHPSVVSKRFELHAIRLEMSKMQAIEKSRVSKMSGTLGSLILNKVALEVELNELLNSLSSQHPDVKKKRFELAALEREIENVLR
jgi:uncharacterized protein involved in exopolysaccharide biosynthesis